MTRLTHLCCLTCIFLFNLPALFFPVQAQSADRQTSVITVQVTRRPANTFLPALALGAGVDGLGKGDVAQVYTSANLRAMRSAGLGALTYRLRTELGVEAWHWNPQGIWTEPGKQQGYWTSQVDAQSSIGVCYGYKLPRRGSTVDQANNDGYSRLDDGDPHTFWKSNPYLDKDFTGEDNTQHPQWALIDLGRNRLVNAIQITWAAPYALRYQIQFWQGDSSDEDTHSISDIFGDGAWTPFPGGTVTRGHGEMVLLRLAPMPRLVRFVRVWMTQSSETGLVGSQDIRDRLGYAVREIGLGRLDARGGFHDWMRHAPDGKQQTPVYVSSTDPWHRSADRDWQTEQPGFDRVFASGLTHGLPLLAPVGILYDTPENAVAEARFFQARGCPVTRLELGEEPDGQYVTPEDYGALYVQWADALHRVNPALKLGGPSFQTAVNGWLAWPDAQGNRSWLNRFLRYLKKRGHEDDFAFFSFEWYPFDDVSAPPAPQLALAPAMLANALARLQREGLSPKIPWLITEYGYSAFAGQSEMEMPGALLNAEIAAQFLTLGGTTAYVYGYEPDAPIQEKESGDSWGNLTLLLSDDSRHLRQPLPTYYAARLLTQQWAQPDIRRSHQLYRAACPLRNRLGLPLVTAYALHRPDGQWAVLLLNKDLKRPHRVTVQFQREGERVTVPFSGPCDLYQYSSAQYVWHPKQTQGYASPDKPPMRRTLSGPDILLPPFSLSVVRGRVAILP